MASHWPLRARVEHHSVLPSAALKIGPGRMAAYKFLRVQVLWPYLSAYGLQHFKKGCVGSQDLGPLPIGGYSSIGPSEYPVSKMLIYFPSPQVQRAVPSSTPRRPSPLAKD